MRLPGPGAGTGGSRFGLLRAFVTGDNPYNVLFLCTHNSARSILAEALLGHYGEGRFQGYSAGSFPRGEVHPLALKALERTGIPTRGLRSKGWEEFARAGAPVMDAVVTVCDQAAGEICPVWPGRPVTVHWGLPDPAAVAGGDAQKRRAFGAALRTLETRIRALVALPDSASGPEEFRRHLQAIGGGVSAAAEEW